jgi:hypothetical protein
MLPVPPSAGMVDELPPIAIWQRSLLGCRTDVEEDPQPNMPMAAAITDAISIPAAVDAFFSTPLRRPWVVRRFLAYA